VIFNDRYPHKSLVLPQGRLASRDNTRDKSRMRGSLASFYARINYVHGLQANYQVKYTFFIAQPNPFLVAIRTLIGTACLQASLLYGNPTIRTNFDSFCCQYCVEVVWVWSYPGTRYSTGIFAGPKPLLWRYSFAYGATRLLPATVAG
jgi:hypothetical protein